MVSETKRPMPENSAMETNCVASASRDADEETPAVFGMTALPVSDQETPVVEISDSCIPVFNCAFHLSANPPQDHVQRPATDVAGPLSGFDHQPR